jgi:hypothetical protein
MDFGIEKLAFFLKFIFAECRKDEDVPQGYPKLKHWATSLGIPRCEDSLGYLEVERGGDLRPEFGDDWQRAIRAMGRDGRQ